MRNVISNSIFFVTLLFSGTLARADSWTFATLPADGAISGPAGSTIGWGYSITNNSSQDWLVLTDLVAGNFQDGTPNAFLFDFPILAPGATAMEQFDVVHGIGLYSLQWDSNAPVGFTNSGNFVASADFYDGDPLGTGSFVSHGLDQTAPYSATVGTAGPVATPEPAGVFMVVGVLASVGLARKFRYSPPEWGAESEGKQARDR